MNAYLRLMRLHQPTGIWLLLWPCWWALALAANGWPPAPLLLLFLLGAVVMRSAGCIINDIVDRDFDKQVERTKSRPLASGELSLRQALSLLAVLLLVGLFMALQMNTAVLWWAVASLVPVGTYPFMKRITWWPQLFLGITFNWGALMGWAAMRGDIEWPAVLLYLGGIFWTLGYDTIYAHQDKSDDVRVGVKSTALRLGAHTKRAVGVFYLLAVFCWTSSGWLEGKSLWFFVAMIVAELHFSWQVCTVNLDNPNSCLRIFKSNMILGWIVMAGLLFGSF